MTPQQFVRRYGGPTHSPAVAAKSIGVVRQVVGNWLRRGRISEAWLLRLRFRVHVKK